jgi:hypothetical protein
VTIGRWLDEDRQWGVEAIYFAVFNDGSTDDYFAGTTEGAGTGAPILARPFYDINVAQENARLFSFPGLADGSVDIATSSALHSAEVLLRRCVLSESGASLDLLAGYR